MTARNCKHLIVKTCAVLHVKCLECRMIGGVENGSCRIREEVPYPAMPSGTRPPRQEDYNEECSEAEKPQRPLNRIVHETKGEVPPPRKPPPPRSVKGKW